MQLMLTVFAVFQSGTRSVLVEISSATSECIVAGEDSAQGLPAECLLHGVSKI